MIDPTLDLTLPALLAGDDTAIEQEVLVLFDEHVSRLRRYIASFGLGAETTDDIVQDVFLALFRHLRLGRSRSNLKAWLFQVGHNLALKQRQRLARRRVIEATWSAEEMDPSANPEEQIAHAEHLRYVRGVLRALPERDRQCLYLRAEGFAYRDISKTLNISLGSVAKSLARAVARLAAGMR